MNPLAVESAFKSALAATAFPTTQINTGTSYDELTPESLNLIISVASYQAVGVGLYTATATVRLVAPALLGAESFSDFSSKLETLKNSLTQEYLLANWPANDAPGFCGSFVEEISTGQESHCWTAEIRLTIGVLG